MQCVGGPVVPEAIWFGHQMGYSRKATPMAVHFGVILTTQASDAPQTCGL